MTADSLGPSPAQPASRHHRVLHTTPGRDGVILVATLWIMTVLAVMALGFATMVRTETRITRNYFDEARAATIAEAGLRKTIMAIERPTSPYVSLDDPPAQRDSDADGLEFEDGGYRVQTVDEAGRLDLNIATEEMLERLTGSRAIAASIIDWRDADDSPGSEGAEDAHYMALSQPYHCKNHPFDTPDELLMVRDVTPQIYYGEMGAEAVTEGRLVEANPEDLPLRNLVTVYAVEPNTDASGQPRLNVNTADADTMRSRLGDVLTDRDLRAIVDYRQGSPATEGMAPPGSAPTGPSGAPMAQRAPGSSMSPTPPTPGPASPASVGPRGGTGAARFGSIGDLLSVPGLTRDKLRRIADRITVTDETKLRGRVNVNTAPARVLRALPKMTDAAVSDILAYRSGSGGPFEQLGDLLAVESVTDGIFRGVANWVTTRSSSFRLVSQGLLTRSRVSRTLECVVTAEVESQARTQESKSAGSPASGSGRRMVVRYWRQ